MGGRNAKTGLGDWGQKDFSLNNNYKYTDAGRFSAAGGTQEEYEGMTPEQRESYAALVNDPSRRYHGQDEIKSFLDSLRAGTVAAPVQQQEAKPEDLYAKLLSGGEGARKQAQDAYYQQAVSRLDPMWSQREEAQRTRLLNQGLDPTSEASQTEMANLGRERNDAYDSAMRASVLAGNTEAHNMLRDKLQSWIAENQDQLSRSQIEKGDKADQMDSVMRLLPALLSMWS